MSKELASPNTEALIANLCSPLQIGAQLAEAPMRSVDCYIDQLNRLGLLNTTLVLGPIVIRRSYGVGGPSDSGQLIQAAISTEHGTAAAFWDSEDYALYKNDPAFEQEAMSRVRPLRDCGPAIRAMVWPHVSELLVRLTSGFTLTKGGLTEND
jgi:hypothetical protein